MVLNEESIMEDRLIKRIITRGVAGDFDNSEELEHIFEFDDGSKMNISKMNTIEIARYAFQNNNEDGNKIFNFINSSQKISKYATLLSVYLMLEMMSEKDNKNSVNESNKRRIFKIIEKLGGNEMLAEIFSVMNKMGSSFMDVLLEKVEIELNRAIKTF